MLKLNVGKVDRDPLPPDADVPVTWPPALEVFLFVHSPDGSGKETGEHVSDDSGHRYLTRFIGAAMSRGLTWVLNAVQAAREVRRSG